MAEVNLTVSADIQGIKAKLEDLTKSIAEIQGKMGNSMKAAAETSEKAMVEASNNITKTMVENTAKTMSAEQKRMALIEQEMADLEKLKAARDKATSVSQYRAMDMAVKNTEKAINGLSQGMVKFRDITNMSLGEMRRYMKELRNISLVGMTPQQIAEVNTKIAQLTDAMGDYRAMVGATGDKTEMLISAFSGVIAAAQGVTGTLALFGYENKNLEKSMMALINLSQAMSTIHQLNEKGILKQTAATIKLTIATWAQEKADAASGKAMKGIMGWIAKNPYLALAVGIAAATAAVYGLIQAFGKQKDMSAELGESQKSVFDDMAQNLGTFKILTENIGKAERGTKDYTAAIEAYNAAAKEQNLMTIGVNDSLADQNTKMKINTDLLVSRAKIQAATNELTKIYGEQIIAQTALEEAMRIKNKWAVSMWQEKLDMYAKQVVGLNNYIDAEKKENKTREDIIILQAENEKKRQYIEGLTSKATANTTTEIKKKTEALIDYNKVLADTLDIEEQDLLEPPRFVKDPEVVSEFRQWLLDELDKQVFETADGEFIPSFDDKMGAALNRVLSGLGIENISKDQFIKLKEIGGMIVSELTDSFKEGMENQIKAIDEYISAREQKIGEIQSLLDAEIQLNEQGFASNIQLYQDQLEQEQAMRDKAAAEKERVEKKQQILNQASQLSNVFTSITELIAANTKLGLPGILLAAASITAMYALLANAKSKAAASIKFEKGGKGIFSGPSHSQGGIKIGDNMEAQGGEAYYILNKSATNSKGRALMDALFDAVNGGRVNFDAPMSLSDGPMSVKLEEQKEIREILGHIKGKKEVIYGQNYRIETFGNVRRKIKNS